MLTGEGGARTHPACAGGVGGGGVGGAAEGGGSVRRSCYSSRWRSLKDNGDTETPRGGKDANRGVLRVHFCPQCPAATVPDSTLECPRLNDHFHKLMFVLQPAYCHIGLSTVDFV